MAQKKKPSDLTRHRLFHLLHHVGWAIGSLGAAHEEKDFTWLVAPSPDGQAIALVMLPGTLPLLDASFRRYEDFSADHRRLLRQLRGLGVATRHLLLVDPRCAAQLIDVAQEDVMLEAADEAAFVERILPLLNPSSLGRGSLSSHPRKSPRQRARELAEWTRLWQARLGLGPEGGDLFFDWLHLGRLAEHLNIGPPASESIASFGEGSRKLNPLRKVTGLLRPLAEQWNLLQGTPFRQMEALIKRASDSGHLGECLESYGRLSRSKFSAELFAEAFADEELRLTGWRHTLVDPEPTVPGHDPAQWLTSPLVVDLDAIGISGVLAAFDAVVEDLRTLAREQAVQRERGERPGLQLDLLGGEPPALQEEEAPRIALKSVIRVRTQKRDRVAVTRLTLLAHTALWYARLHRTELLFPEPVIEVVGAVSPRPLLRPTAPRIPSDPSLN